MVFWYDLGKGWGWDEEYTFDEVRQQIMVPVSRYLPSKFWPGPSLEPR